MDYIKYHPLVDADTEGQEKVPMFFSIDEAAVASANALYLEEITPRTYRLMAVNAVTDDSAYRIHCPNCGVIMNRISNPIDAHKRALYTCPKCR